MKELIYPILSGTGQSLRLKTTTQKERHREAGPEFLSLYPSWWWCWWWFGR